MSLGRENVWGGREKCSLEQQKKSVGDITRLRETDEKEANALFHTAIPVFF
jgi:hypothetical protein